jgi:hypothetical protein
MNWDKASKNKLQQVVWEKFRAIYSSTDNEWAARHLRSRFFMEFGISRIDRPLTRRNKFKDRIIILDPWSGRHLKHLVYDINTGLSIPKDIAEKFLMLGVP